MAGTPFPQHRTLQRGLLAAPPPLQRVRRHTSKRAGCAPASALARWSSAPASALV